MAKVSFTIPGDPIPYTRMTQGQVAMMRIPDSRIRSGASLKVKRRIQRYLGYKDLALLLSRQCEFDRHPEKKAFLNVVCFFRNRSHGDPENIRKGIQDAIYDQDKMVAGSVDFFYDAENPRCEVEIVESEA